MNRSLSHKLYSAYDVLCIHGNMAWSTLRARLSASFQGCVVGKDFRSSGPIRIKARASGSIVIGNHVRLLAHWRSNRVGMSGPVILHTWEGGKIEIGDHSGASAVVISSRVGVKIGKHCNIGGNVRIYDHDFHSLDADVRRGPRGCEDCKRRPIVIGDDVFIGANSIILKGVTIGDGAVIGAGSVVSRDVAAGSIAAGNPAEVVKKRRTEAGGRTTEDGWRKTRYMKIESAKDLEVYQMAYAMAMEIFNLSKDFPPEEKYALTSQIRRSSRSISMNLREAWAKLRYEAHFISKLTDCDGEANETDTSLDFALDCGYITAMQHADLVRTCDSIRRMLGSMLKSPKSFLII